MPLCVQVLTAHIQAGLRLLENKPSLPQYRPAHWADYHALPLPVAAAARLKHTAALERLAWPAWRRRIADIVEMH